MARLSSAATLLVVIATAAHANWIAVSSETDRGFVPGLEHQHVVFQKTETQARAVVDLAIFSAKSFAARIVDNPGGQIDLADAMAPADCVAGINGGYFDEDFAPIGLLIVDGKTIASFQRTRLLTGVFLATAQSIQIIRAGEYPVRSSAQSAVQAGPFLIDLSRPVRGLEAMREARRSFAATAGARVALGYCSEVSLAELAALLGAGFSGLKIQRALNLDGGSSSAFWFKRRNGSAFSIPEEKPVRDFIGITTKQ